MENSNSQAYQRAINSYASQITNKRGRLSSIEEGLDAKKRAEQAANYNISFQTIQDKARSKLLSSLSAKQREDALAIQGSVLSGAVIPALQKGVKYGARLLKERRENVVNQKAYDEVRKGEDKARGAEEPKNKGPRFKAQDDAPREEARIARPREESFADDELNPDVKFSSVDSDARIARLNDALNADRGVSVSQGGETAVENLARNRAESAARSEAEKGEGRGILARARARVPLGGRKGLHASQAQAEAQPETELAPRPTLAEGAAGRGSSGAGPSTVENDQLAPMREFAQRQVDTTPKASLESQEASRGASSSSRGASSILQEADRSALGDIGEVGGEVGGEAAAEAGGALAETAGAGLGEAALGAASIGLDFLGPLGIAAGLGFALYDIFGNSGNKEKAPAPPPPPKPVEFVARQAQFGRQSVAVAPSQNTAAQQSGAIGAF